jgi:hypothetical protein
MGQQLGLAHAQIMHLLAQEKKDDPVQIQSSSSSGGPPPDDAKPKAKMQSKRAKEAASPADEKPKAKSKAAPKTPGPPPGPPPKTPASEASTIYYPPVETPRGRSQEPRSRSTRGKGPAQFSIATPRASSERATPSLPASTPHTKTKAEKIVQQLIDAQSDELVKSNVRRNLNPSWAGLKVTARPKNPMIAPKRAQTYDEVAEAAIVSEQQVPFGAATTRQRIDTPGKMVRKYQGQRIRPM